MLAMITGGRAIMQTRASSHDITISAASKPISSKPLVTNWTSPSWISSCSESMSDVMRATSLPVCSRSKKPIDMAWMWSNTRTRRSRRNDSPTRLTSRICSRDSTRAMIDTTRKPMAARSRLPELCFWTPWSMPYLISAGPATVASV